MVMIGQECCCISKVLTLSRQPYVTERFIMSPLAAVSENNDQFCSVPLVITTSITCKLSQCHCFFFFVCYMQSSNMEEIKILYWVGTY